MSPGFEDVRKLAWWDPRPPLKSDPAWAESFQRIFREALKILESQEATNPDTPLGESLPLALARRQGTRVRESATLHWEGYLFEPERGGRPKPLSALPVIAGDETRECYGTSGELDPRGYWMPIDVESDQGPRGATNS